MKVRNQRLGHVALVAALSPLIWASALGADFVFTPNTAGGFGNYRWDVDIGNAPTAENPTLYLARGTSYSFSVTTFGIHPFWIDNTPGLGGVDPYSGTGLTGNGMSNPTTASSLTFDVPADAPETLHYSCGNHAEMNGPINIVIFRSGFD